MRNNNETGVHGLAVGRRMGVARSNRNRIVVVTDAIMFAKYNEIRTVCVIVSFISVDQKVWHQVYDINNLFGVLVQMFRAQIQLSRFALGLSPPTGHYNILSYHIISFVPRIHTAVRTDQHFAPTLPQ